MSLGLSPFGNTSSPLILVVDDDESDRELARRALTKGDIACRVEFAFDGQQAIDYLLDPTSEVPSLILLDLKMPRLNGHEVLQKLRSIERTRNVAVVVFTSSDQTTDIGKSCESGANSFVRKVTEFDDYITRLREVARYWLTINEPCP